LRFGARRGIVSAANLDLPFANVNFGTRVTEIINHLRIGGCPTDVAADVLVAAT
jgi:hypothetical protein